MKHEFIKRKDFLPFAKPTIGKEEIDEITDTLKSGWITTGPKTEKFAKNFAEYVGAKYSLALNSATAGLHIAQIALGLKEGDEVITTPLTFVASANTAIHAGGKVKFADIELETLNINPKALEAAVTGKTKIIIPVHFAGLPCDMDKISAIANKANAFVLEDCAHAVGSEYKGKKLGSSSDMCVFSFHPNKNMTTGEGGIITFNDEKYLKPLTELGFHGINKKAYLDIPDRSAQDYDVVYAGFKDNMLDMQACLGLHQLAKLDGFNAKRKTIFDFYSQELANVEELIIPKAPAYEHKHCCHIYTPLLKTEKLTVTRNGFMDKMKDLNIGLGLHYRAIHEHTFYQNLGFKKGMFPNAEYAGQRIISLPLFPLMTLDDAKDVVRTLKYALAGSLNK